MKILAVALCGLLAASSDIPARREFPVDAAINPCNDFYGYACNKVIASFKLRDDRSQHTFSFNDASERLLKAKQAYFADLVRSKGELPPRSRELRDVYTACMSEPAGKADEASYVTAILAEVDAVKTPADWVEFVKGKVVSKDFGIFQFGSTADQDDPDKQDVYVLGSLDTLPERSYYDKKPLMKDFEDLVTTFFQAIGRKDASKRAKAVVAFEKEFVQTMPLPAEYRELFNSKTTLSKDDFAKKYKDLPLDVLLARVPATTPFRDITPANFTWLAKALREKPLDVWKDVYLWHALSESMDDGYPAFFKKQFAFNNKHLGGPEKRPVRDERCTRHVMDHFTKEVDAELVDKIFPGFPTETFVAMTEKVRASLVAGLETNTWLTPDVRKRAAEKMRSARLQLVKPTEEADWDFHPAADYDPAKPVENERTFQAMRQEKTFSRLAKPRNRKQWDMGPLTVNAYYSPSDNKFVMPIGILQYPFFDPKAPEEENLGAIGVVIGHELGHGVDDKGSRYDELGRLAPWMGEKDLTEFKKRSARLVDQFNKIGHNGELTLGENIGDLVGLTFAYQAAFPGGKGTIEAKKAFFTQFGRAWCQVQRPKLRERLLKTDPHSMGDARVNQQVTHQTGFYEAFGCKAGDKLFLKPEERVVIW